MRWVFFIWFVWQGMVGNSQDSLSELQAPPQKFEAKFVMGLGINLPFYIHNNLLEHPFDLAQKSNTLGATINLGLQIHLLNRFGIECNGGFGVFSFRRKYFERKFQERMGEVNFLGDETQDVTNSGGEGMDIVFLHPKIYFVLNPGANNKIVPIAGVQFSKYHATTMMYALRQPATNYFTTYKISQTDFSFQPMLSLGAECRRTFTAMDQKGRILNSHASLRVMFLYGKYQTGYSTEISENNQEEYSIETSAEHTLFYTTIELSIMLFGTH